MADYFLDTSALVKRYHIERGTPNLDYIWNDAEARLFVSRLGIIETISAFAKKVRSGALLANHFYLLRRRFFADLSKGRPVILPLLPRHFQEADRLLRDHGLFHGLHTLDALQLAVALDLTQLGVPARLVTADHVLLNMASFEGLLVNDPELP